MPYLYRKVDGQRCLPRPVSLTGIPYWFILWEFALDDSEAGRGAFKILAHISSRRVTELLCRARLVGLIVLNYAAVAYDQDIFGSENSLASDTPCGLSPLDCGSLFGSRPPGAAAPLGKERVRGFQNEATSSERSVMECWSSSISTQMSSRFS